MVIKYLHKSHKILVFFLSLFFSLTTKSTFQIYITRTSSPYNPATLLPISFKFSFDFVLFSPLKNYLVPIRIYILLIYFFYMAFFLLVFSHLIFVPSNKNVSTITISQSVKYLLPHRSLSAVIIFDAGCRRSNLAPAPTTFPANFPAKANFSALVNFPSNFQRRRFFCQTSLR